MIHRLDVLEGELSAVSRVRGSDRLQTAYRLDRQVDLTKDTRYCFEMSLSYGFIKCKVLLFIFGSQRNFPTEPSRPIQLYRNLENPEAPKDSLAHHPHVRCAKPYSVRNHPKSPLRNRRVFYCRL